MARAMAFLRLWVFRHRGIIPIPFVISVAVFNRPTYPYESALDILLDALGFVVVLAGLGLRLWAVGHAGAQTRSYKLRAPRLVTSGPYAYVRNPIYVGNLLIGLGVVIMAESWAALLVLLVVFVIEYGAIVSLEEEFLAATFGVAYEQYRRHVPRWMPRFSAAPVAGADGFFWRAVRKEHQALISALGMALTVELAEAIFRLSVR